MATPVGADLVGRVAVGGDAIGADHHHLHRPPIASAKRPCCRKSTVTFKPAFSQFPTRLTALPEAAGPGLVGEDPEKRFP